MLQIYILVGSLRKGSINKQLALSVEKLGTDLFVFEYCPLADIPLYNQDLEEQMPGAVIQMKKHIKEADGILFFTPEYNRSIPGVLKNAIDWASRPMGANSWGGKPTGILGVSPGPVGTGVAQSHLRSILTMLGMIVMAQPEIYLSTSLYSDLLRPDNTIGREDSRNFLRRYLEKFSQWIPKHR